MPGTGPGQSTPNRSDRHTTRHGTTVYGGAVPFSMCAANQDRMGTPAHQCILSTGHALAYDDPETAWHTCLCGTEWK